MNPNAQFERDLEQWLQTEAPASAPAGFHASVIDRARTLRQRPGWTTTPWPRRLGRGRGITLLAAALLLVGGVLAAGSGLLRRPAVIPPVPAPSLAAVAPSPEPSASPTPMPTPTPPPIVWTQASLRQDWPAPVRQEPTGGASVAPMPPTYIDAIGDTGPDAVSYVDIRDVTASTASLSFDLTSKPPTADPSRTWVAYGLVVDEDRDGIPDWRYGIDNVPSAMAKDVHRAWRTNLHTGVTEFDPDPEPNGWGVRGDPLFRIGATQFGTGYPGASATSPRFLFSAHGDVAGGGTYAAGAKQDKPFYVWASAIVDGRIVATDYAPDAGWLRATPDGTNPGGTYVLAGRHLDAPFGLSMTVPQGWPTAGPSLEPPNPRGTSLRFLNATYPAAWACATSGKSIKPSVGPTAEDLASFLSHQRTLTISKNAPVTVDGHDGIYLEFTTSYDGETTCDPGDWPYETAAFHQLWILDVDGLRMAIDGSAPNASAANKAEFGQVVGSIAFESPTTAEPVPSPRPTPTPTPMPTAAPTPFPPAAGPVPPNARTWTITVDNKSSEPAALFVAEENGSGELRLVGSATPNVVPPGATLRVTFRFPVKGGPDGWIYVNPRPGEGGSLVHAADIGIPGKIVITADGQAGWLSP